MKTIAIIGSGFSGLSSAAYLATAGYKVHVYEKNSSIGGRARSFSASGYSFDMGPSWYWMPDVFEKFFADFGKKTSDFYELKLLEPAFDIVYGLNDIMHVPSDFEQLCAMFESIEPGSGQKLRTFMNEAAYKYHTGVDNLVYKPGLSLSEFFDWELVRGVFKLQVFSSLRSHVAKFFKHPKLVALMEFPVLFLGAMPQDIPALYSLMNYAGLKLKTWYPMGGFISVINGMANVAVQNGTTIHCNSAVEKIMVNNNKVTGLLINGEVISCDAVVASADYHHVETELLEPQYANYNQKYWQKKTFAPSCLIYYLGINKSIPNLEHHTLFFDQDLEQHAVEIYKNPSWPSQPLFYACCPSKTDDNIAPKGHENLFLLMPLAPGLQDDEHKREQYFQLMMQRLEAKVGTAIQPYIDFKQSYCVNDFIHDYNAYKGNAYGLANTLRQTAILKPKLINKKLNNLIYTGQLTVPGPGVPPSIISGKVAAQYLINQLKHQTT